MMFVKMQITHKILAKYSILHSANVSMLVISVSSNHTDANALFYRVLSVLHKHVLIKKPNFEKL